MKKLNDDEIKAGIFKVLKKLKEICEKNSIKYYLFFGTMLGAVRHNGFIPWDDDADVIMLRKDYERFISYCKKHEKEIYPFKIFHYSVKKDCSISIARFYSDEYDLRDLNNNRYMIGLFVDIYPFDYVGDSLDDVKTACAKVSNWYKRTDPYRFMNISLFKSNFKKIISIPFFLYQRYFHDNRFWVAELDWKYKLRNRKPTKYVGCAIWQTDIGSYIPSSSLDPLKIKFEDDYYPIVKNYDEVLRNIYGNYLELPKEEKRIGHHDYIAYLK